MGYNNETTLREDVFIVSETDSKGNIIFVNNQFCQIAEYSLEELLGQPHNIVRHPDMQKLHSKTCGIKYQKVMFGKGL